MKRRRARDDDDMDLGDRTCHIYFLFSLMDNVNAILMGIYSLLFRVVPLLPGDVLRASCIRDDHRV